MPSTPVTPIDPRVEMFQRGHSKDAFFNMKALAPRPISSATEFDTDFEEDDSEIEDNSPRLSLNSAGRRSETTLSSFEEVHTPGLDQEFHGFRFDLPEKKPVEGPRGPHLFRTSGESERIQDEEYYLAMSPVTPRPTSTQRAAMNAPQVPQIASRHRPLSSLTDAVDSLNQQEVAHWTPRQVARWMYDAGFEPSIVEKFEENDISGAILITLKFEDLRELDIPSFGTRTKVWNEIHVLRGSAPSTPKPPTPIEDISSPCTEFRRPTRSSSTRDKSQGCGSDEEPRRHKSGRKHRRPAHEDIISPLESVSIVGIEQLMPKPHKCSRGEKCSKWRKQQRLIDAFKKEHPVSPERGYIWVAGDPGNPLTADAVAEAVRPVSDAVPSVVASSDVLGPGPVPTFRQLEEASLRKIQTRDPQDNVKQFIQFQHMDPNYVPQSSEEPPTPPYEMFPSLPTPHAGLRSLPRLAIPPPRPAPPPRSASANAFSPYRMERVEAMSPDLRSATQSPSTVYRFGTPFSEMDIPVTAINLGPVARDASQSVPPNMNYRHGGPPVSSLQRTQSRCSARRPSVTPMPRLDENTPVQQRPLVAPIRPPPPQSQSQFHAHSQPQQSYPQFHTNAQTSPRTSQSTTDLSTTHSGPMKKRKTRLLRHEWHSAHFTLKGTLLSMHKDSQTLDKTLEYIDVDDYAIACSSLASGSKLNAAFKAMSISRADGKGKRGDDAAFAFQLIPASEKERGSGGAGRVLRKRESTMGASAGGGSGALSAGGAGPSAGGIMSAAPSSGVEGKSKTHYFAVKSRDERIDWMRELMLAKALKQKSEGYEINVNGNMI